jgi:hypothetical protein
MSTPRVSFRTALVLPLLFLATIALPRGAAAVDDRLALRTDDAQGVPGGVVAVVVRTYASRAIGQGQITFRAIPVAKSLVEKRWGSGGSGGAAAATEASPFVSLESFVIFSARQDARFAGEFNGRRAVLSFRSPTRSINAADGPLAIFYFRLSNDVQPGQEFDIGVDESRTVLFDAQEQPIALKARPGRLEIRQDTGSLPLTVESAVVSPGRTGVIGVEVPDVVPLASGRVGFRYDATIARKPPTVVIDPRKGHVQYTVDAATPGLVLISFESSDASFNRYPGRLFEVRIPTRAVVRPGTVSPLSLDPSLTWLTDAEGHVLPLALENGTLQFQ